MKRHTFREEVFDFNVHLLVPCSAEQFAQCALKIAGERYNPADKFHGICLTTDTDMVIGLQTWKPDARHFSLLLHEVAHGVHAALLFRELKLSDETTEIFCRLEESIFRRCLKKLGIE